MPPTCKVEWLDNCPCRHACELPVLAQPCAVDRCRSTARLQLCNNNLDTKRPPPRDSCYGVMSHVQAAYTEYALVIVRWTHREQPLNPRFPAFKQLS